MFSSEKHLLKTRSVVPGSSATIADAGIAPREKQQRARSRQAHSLGEKLEVCHSGATPRRKAQSASNARRSSGQIHPLLCEWLSARPTAWDSAPGLRGIADETDLPRLPPLGRLGHSSDGPGPPRAPDRLWSGRSRARSRCSRWPVVCNLVLWSCRRLVSFFRNGCLALQRCFGTPTVGLYVNMA